MKKLILLFAIGMSLLAVFSDAQMRETWGPATAAGVVDSSKTDGFDYIVLIGRATKTDTVAFRLQGAHAMGTDDWSNLDADGDSTEVVPAMGTDDSTFVIVYDGYVPFIRLYLDKVVGTGASITFERYLFNK